MNFQELCSEVQQIVKRPDLSNDIESAVRSATLKLHHASFWYRDRKETGVTFSTPSYITNFNPTEVIPNYRKPSYIRKWNYDPTDISLGRPGKILQLTDIGNIVDYYGFQKVDIYYLAGDLIQIRSSTELSHILFGAYVHPIVTPEEQYNSWIAKEYPWAIIYEAVAKIFRNIGLVEQSNGAMQDAMMSRAEITLSNQSELGE